MREGSDEGIVRGGRSETYTGSSSGSEDETAEVGSALVAQGASGVDESSDTVGLETSADERSAPGNGSAAGLLGLEELLLGVGGLGALEGLAEEGGEDGELDAVVEDQAEGDGRRLNGGEVY